MSQQIKRLEHRIRKYDRLVSEWEDTVTLCEMAQEDVYKRQAQEDTGASMHTGAAVASMT